WKDGLVARLDLPPLSVTQLGDLIGRALGGTVSDRTVDRLAVASGGNVLHARELVTAAVEEASLVPCDGVWVWDERVVLAPRLVDAVWARLEALTDAQRWAMTLVALGEPLPVVIAESLAAPPLLSSLEDASLIRLDRTGEQADLRLVHPLHGAVLLERLGWLDRRHLLETLATAFEGDPREVDRAAVRIATWRLDSGQEVSREALLRAATRANRAFDHELAARLGRAALAATPTGEPLTHAIVELSRALVGSGRFEEAHRLLVEAEDTVLAAGDPGLVDAYLDVRFHASYVGLGRTAHLSPL